MTLDAYLKANGISSAAFARIASLGTRGTVHRYRTGQVLPSAARQMRIYVATGQQVRPDDFVDHMTRITRSKHKESK